MDGEGQRPTTRARTRRAVVNGLLVVVTVWPLVHIALVFAYDLSPWKLAGWGMYSAPRMDAYGMEIYGGMAGAAQLDQLTAPSASLRLEANAFLESFRWLRRLASPAALVKAVWNDQPLWERVRIVVHETEVDRTTGRIVPKETVIERAKD
jgi:hypothetical protein